MLISIVMGVKIIASKVFNEYIFPTVFKANKSDNPYMSIEAIRSEITCRMSLPFIPITRIIKRRKKIEIISKILI